LEHYDYIILGGGITGLTFARLLQQHTNKTFIVLEKEPEHGGLCRTKNIDGNYFDIGGGHFLYSKHQQVYDFIFSHIPESEFNRFNRVTKINIHGTQIDYPIENNIWQLPPEKQLEYLNSIIDSMEQEMQDNNFEEWIIKKLGRSIYENYLKPYNEKIWGVPVSEMSIDWLYKIPKVDLKEILKSILLKQADSNLLPSHEYFYYPKVGGFQVIVDSIYEKVKDHVRLSEPVTSMEYKYYHFEHHHVINGKYTTGKVINTVTWDALPLIHLRHPAISQLKHNSIEVTITRGEYDNNTHWEYEPNKKIDFHRLFYVNNYAKSNKDKCIATETNMNRIDYTITDEHDILGAFKNEYAYPIPTKGSKEAIAEIISYYRGMNIFGIGRWGEWSYHNSDICIHNCHKLIKELENVLI
jgi:protoporphyrinogen oxidase